MREVLLKQLDAADAQVELLRVMLKGMRHQLEQPRAVQAPLPAECAKHSAEDCARQNDEAVIEGGGMAGGQYMCRGCGDQNLR